LIGTATTSSYFAPVSAFWPRKKILFFRLSTAS
jgi:hypothetical protein